jgi:N6-adenosine-specific RNA methylase IME4/ParB-like chromosome segregation protein Spo0J
MSGAEYEALVADIREHGQREPIWLHDGRIIDGRNRYRACVDLGIEPETREWDGGGSLVAFVVSLNLHRRHLNESQRGTVAARLANLTHGGDRRSDQAANLPLEAVTQQEAASLLSVSERTVRTAKAVLEDGAPELIAAVESGEVSVSAAADVATLPVEEQREIVARGESEILAVANEIRARKRRERRAKRIQKLAEISAANAPLDTALGPFPILYCDPPWRYEHCSDDADAVENHYPTLELAEICALPVGDIATPDAMLFLWATSPKLCEAFEVLRAWGFTYRTCAVWDKELIGPGYYFRQQHELLLVATRGNVPVPLPENRPSSVIRERRTEHSRKPARVADLIAAMYPELPRVELFARERRDG